MNVICIVERLIVVELAKDLATAFLNARFASEERHRRRLEKVVGIEQRALVRGDEARTLGGTA